MPLPNLIIVGFQIAELQGVGGFRPPPSGLTDFKKVGLTKVKAGHSFMDCLPKFTGTDIIYTGCPKKVTEF